MNIFKATKKGDYERVKELLDNGVDVNIVDNCENNTPLHYASAQGYIKIARLLIERGANINALNYYEISPLSNACYNKKLEIVKLLLENNANVNIVDNDDYTLLHDVCNNNNNNNKINVELIELVISYGVDDFTVENNINETPLDFLSRSDRNDLVEKYKNYEPKGKLIKAAKKNK